MNIGDRFSLAWKHPHRVEIVITALERDAIVVEAEHRCGFHCSVGKLLDGEMRFRYQDFTELFLPINADAIALPASH